MNSAFKKKSCDKWGELFQNKGLIIIQSKPTINLNKQFFQPISEEQYKTDYAPLSSLRFLYLARWRWVSYLNDNLTVQKNNKTIKNR